MNNMRRFSKLIIMFAAIMISYQIMLCLSVNSASAASSSSWVLADHYDNPYLYVDRIEGNSIILYGEHHKKQNDNYYETDYFVATAQDYVKSGSFPNSAKDNRVSFSKNPISDDGTTVTMQYTIKFEDLVAMAGQLGITGESIGNGTKPIYLHMVFDIYKGDRRMANDVIGLQEMIHAPVDYRLGYTAWDAGTLEKLPSYYNMRFDLSVSSTYNVKVVAVDKDKKSIMEDPLYTKKVIFNEKFEYSLPSTYKEIKKNGITYKYSNTWKYKYTARSPEKSIETNRYSTAKVGFTTPDAMPGSTLTVYMYFDNPVKPTPTPKPGTATPTPKPGAPTPTPKPIIIPTPVPAEPISIPLDTPSPDGVIDGDKYGAKYFNSETGIPTTESQYVYVKTKDYLLGYSLVNRTGKMSYSVKVTKNYTLQYMTATPIKYGEPKPVSTTESRSQVISVERAYSYWEIERLDYYYASTAKVYNYSLPGGSVVLDGNVTYLKIPSLSTWHSSSLLSHVMAPEQVASGITLDGGTISSSSSTKPSIPSEDFTSYAWNGTSEASVKNDSIIFNGNVVMSDAITRKIAPSPNVTSFVQCPVNCHDKGLFTENKVIDAEKENGNYSSSGTVTYQLHTASVNSSASTKTYNVPVNNVIIHTPVICKPIVTGDNDKWTQLIKPQVGAVQVVLDPDSELNDFTVKISNTLEHSDRLGYRVRDFSRSFIDPDNVSYIAKKDGVVRNEVKFPFDVYVDKLGDGLTGNDIFLKANTWYILGRDTHRFYVPMWVQEGVYTADFRCIAVNGISKLDKTEVARNERISNYVATATMNFEVSGRIYGLTLYDISDYPRWENVFRKDDTMHLKYFDGAIDGTKMSSYHEAYAYYYTVGTKDQYGMSTERLSKYTFPLINGSHPHYKNLGVLKTGYAVRFRLDTTGEMYGGLSHIKIIPSFYHVDADGKNRRQVDLYYSEEINGKTHSVVKVGAGIDLANIKTGSMGNIYNRIPETEIANTAKVLNTTYAKVANQVSPMFSYSQFKLLNAFRTFIGVEYSNATTKLSSFDTVIEDTGLSEISLTKYMQRWYGNYKLPTNVYAVVSGYDVMGYMKNYGIDYREGFWIKGGYIIVNFNIVTMDQSGKERLSYINASNYLNNENCSMWVTEGAIVQKTDYSGKLLNFKAGDCFLYYLDKKYTDDYDGVLY